MSADQPDPSHKHWQRARYQKQNGETGVRISAASADTLTTIKGESPIVVEDLRKAGEFVGRQISRKEYLDRVREFIEKTPSGDHYGFFIKEIRKRFPGLDGCVGTFVMSDAGLRELIDRAWMGKKIAPAKLYDHEIERSTYGEVKAGTSKTYRKPSKTSRQRKQARPGRPPKNPT